HDPILAARTRWADGHLAPDQQFFCGAPCPRGVMTETLTQPLLAVDDLQVAYHSVAVALHGITLRVMPQTIVALVGNNGAGKTTTLRAISGFIGLDDARVIAGNIRFGGQRIEN